MKDRLFRCASLLITSRLKKRPPARSRRGNGIVVYILLLIGQPALVCGQESATGGAINGSVRDLSGGVLPGAAVSVRALATNQTRTVAADAQGKYAVSALPVGTYEVSVRAEGFTPYVNPAVEVVLGRATLLHISLQPAGASQIVTVTERPPALDTTATSSTTSIDPERIAELPVNSRNYLEFTLLAPGVAPSFPQGAGGSSGSANAAFPDSGFTFGGLRPRSNAITIDGLNNTDATTGAARVPLSPEVVREFQIVNNGISAEFGGGAGGAINVVTRTGSNQFHGSVFYFLQNERFNSRDPLSGAQGDKRPKHRRHQFGASAGGPLKADQAFFYAGIEQEHLRAEEESDIGSDTRSQIDAGLRSGIAPRLPLRALASGSFPVGEDETEASAKLAFLVGSRHTLNFRFAFANDRVRGDASSGDTLTDPSSLASRYTKDYQFTASALSIFSPAFINDVRFQSSNRRVLHASPTQGPGVEIVGRARLGAPYEGNSLRRELREDVVETISLPRSRYEWKGGLAFNHISLANHAREGFGGLFVFRSPEDFVAGRPTSWRQAFGDPRTELRVKSVGAFLQNQWRAHSQVTLNLGVRYDVDKLPAPFHADRNNFSPRAGLAWSPSKRWVIRSGLGIFYDRLPLAYLNRVVQKNGAQAFEQIGGEGEATRVFGETGGGTAVNPLPGILPSVFRADADFVTPYSAQLSAGVERLLSPNLTLRAESLFTRGVHLPRTRNINLLLPVLLTPANAATLGYSAPTAQQIGRLVFPRQRLDPRFDAVYQLENSAYSGYRGLTLALNKRLSNGIQFLAAYTFSKTIDDASDFDDQPQNPFNLRSERAVSRHHLGQRFVFNGIFELPFEAEDRSAAGSKKEGWVGAVLGNIEVAPIITISSGRPVNALTGSDEEQSRAFPLASRPLGFSRNSLRIPRHLNVDLRLVKYLLLGGSTPYSTSGHRRIDFVVEFFNLFNHPNVLGLNPFFGSGAAAGEVFAMPTRFAPARQIRFSMDIEF